MLGCGLKTRNRKRCQHFLYMFAASGLDHQFNFNALCRQQRESALVVHLIDVRARCSNSRRDFGERAGHVAYEIGRAHV